MPYALGLATYWKWRERRFTRRMTAECRIMTFDELINKIEAREGTIIHEWYSVVKGPIRNWWTPDDVYAQQPGPWADRFRMKKRGYESLVEWCFRRYTSPTEGTALFFVVRKAQRKSFGALLETARSVDVPAFSREGW
ncbi:MAG TPA: hypothetical protein VNW47_02490 [Terriglobales bacterium]|nr:hypothetical protein [Terriglobales bacterium]